jgi:small-conductance mechanosensitive channel
MKNDTAIAEKIMDLIYKSLISPNFYSQSIAVVASLILSILTYKIILRFVISRINKDSSLNDNLVKLTNSYLVPLLLPLIMTFFLVIGLSIFSQFFKEAILFSATLQLMILFLFLRFLRISSNNSFIANSLGLFLMPALVLDILGLLDTIIKYLDHYAIEIGEIRVSIYLVIKAFIILLIVFWASNLISKKTKTFIKNNQKIKLSTKIIINKFIDLLLYFIFFVVALRLFGFDMTTITVIGGAVGVGIGFGLQKIASNFISGIILLFEKSIEVGDLIEMDNGSISGYLKSFSARYGLIETMDGKEIMIPNEDFITSKVTNLTHSHNRIRIEINLGVAYGSDLKLVRELMIEAAKEYERCLHYPETECHPVNFADFDIRFTLFFWVNDVTAGRMNARGTVLMSIWKKFKQHNIEIPLPQREIKITHH